MPKQIEKILKYNPGEKSLKVPFVIYLDLECLLKKEQFSDNNNNDNNNNNNNLKKSYTQKKAKHESSGWAMFTRCSFDRKENELNYYRRKDCTMKIINYGEKEIIPLTKEEKKSYKNQDKCHICEEKFCIDKDDKDYINRKKVKDHCHYTGKFRGNS